MKEIIIDKDKFKIVQKPEGLNLESYNTIKRFDKTGESTKTFGQSWFLTPKRKALFKNYNIAKNGIRIVNELIYDDLAKQIDLPVAKYIPANFKSYPISYFSSLDKDEIKKPKPEKIYYGLTTIDVTKENEELMSGAELLDYDEFYGDETLEDYIKALDIFKEGEGYYVDKSNINSTLVKMMILDALTFMEDRNYYNVAFIKSDKDGYLIPSPVIDNEMCFVGKNLWYEKNKNFKNLSLKSFLDLHGQEIRLVVNKSVKSVPYAERYQENIKELVKFCAKNKSIKKYLVNVLNNIDIEKSLTKVEKLGYKISTEYKQFVTDLFEFSKYTFKKYTKQFFDENREESIGKELVK